VLSVGWARLRLRALAPDEGKFYVKGAKEVEASIKETK